jgi:hypothetical protein
LCAENDWFVEVGWMGEVGTFSLKNLVFLIVFNIFLYLSLSLENAKLLAPLLTNKIWRHRGHA